MTRPLTVAFLADYFTSWMGGAQLLANLVHGLERAAPADGTRIELLMHARSLPAALREGFQGHGRLPRETLRVSGPLAALLQGTEVASLVFYDDLHATTEALGIDVFGPTGDDLGPHFPRPWFGYVPDFQHQYLDHFFSQAERMRRDQHLRGVVENCHGLFVNSGTVANDIERFYPGASRRKKILRLPLMLPNLDQVADADAVATQFGLQRPFFLSCSQRWLHKQHPLVLRAFADLLALNPDLPVDLVFTGETSDHRDPAHAGQVDALIDSLGLRGRVHVLGMIPREQQLALVGLAMGVVQASLFEGGPGASGTLEAALLGTPIIASDIAPNRELALGRCRFFDAHSALALSEQMGRLVADLAGQDPSAPVRPPFDASARSTLEQAGGLQLLGALRSAARG